MEAALPLAEKAVRLARRSAVYRNTLGVAYYRAGRYREAAEVLRPNLGTQEDKDLALDLYFLAMSHHRLGEAARARDYLRLGGPLVAGSTRHPGGRARGAGRSFAPRPRRCWGSAGSTFNREESGVSPGGPERPAGTRGDGGSVGTTSERAGSLPRRERGQSRV